MAFPKALTGGYRLWEVLSIPTEINIYGHTSAQLETRYALIQSIDYYYS